MKTLTASEIAKAGMRLRTSEGESAVPRAPEPKRDPVLEMLDALRISMENMREALLEQKPEPKDENTALVLHMVMRALDANTRMLGVIQNTLEQEDEPPIIVPDPPDKEEWSCTPTYDSDGRIKHVKIKAV